MRRDDLIFHRLDRSDVAAARVVLAMGGTLEEAARSIGCLRRELDVELWHRIGEEADQRPYEPMF